MLSFVGSVPGFLDLPLEIIEKILEYVLPPWHLCQDPMHHTEQWTRLSPYRIAIRALLPDLPGNHRTSPLYPQQGVFLACRELSTAAKSIFWRSFAGHMNIPFKWSPDVQQDSKHEEPQHITSILSRVTDLTIQVGIDRPKHLTATLNSLPCLRNVNFCCTPSPSPLPGIIGYYIRDRAGLIWKSCAATRALENALYEIESLHNKLEMKIVEFSVHLLASPADRLEVPCTMLAVDVKFHSNEFSITEKRLYARIENSHRLTDDNQVTPLLSASWKVVNGDLWPREAIDLSADMERLVSSRETGLMRDLLRELFDE